MSVDTTESPWLNSDEAVRYLRLPSRRALYQRMRRGTIRYYRDGRRILFRRDELDALPEPGIVLNVSDRASTVEVVTPVCRKQERR